MAYVPTHLSTIFVNSFQMWESAIECLAIMDVLVSMAMYSGGSDMCRPEVCDSSVVPFLDIRGGRHPCVTRTYSGDDFIPNDVSINSEQVSINSDYGIVIDH